MMKIISFQPELRPELPLVDGAKEYNQQRALFERLDQLLSMSSAQLQYMRKSTTLAFRSKLARLITGLDHRGFCIRLADSALIQWFLGVNHVDGAHTFAKSTSDRFAHHIDAASLQSLNAKLIALLNTKQSSELALKTSLSFKAVYFDSTCLKAPIHHPVDWVLLRDATRSLMKAVKRIRTEGLFKRMPQEPLVFLSQMNTLCRTMTAMRHTREAKKHRKHVLREMKTLLKRVVGHAQRHLDLLKQLERTPRLHSGHIQQITTAMESIIQQVPTIIQQAHERIIGGRKLPNKDKVLSLYDPDVEIIKRGKSNAEVEFGNNLWLGESQDGLIVDYLFEKEKTSDTQQIEAAVDRRCAEQSLPVSHVWGDRTVACTASPMSKSSRPRESTAVYVHEKSVP